MRHHLPRDSTRSTVRPVRGASSLTRAIGASAVSKLTTGRPARALLRARAARKIVSPSGIGAHLASVARQGREQAADVEAHRAGNEARIEERPGKNAFGYRDPINGGDEHTRAAGRILVAITANTVDEELGETAGYVGASG